MGGKLFLIAGVLITQTLDVVTTFIGFERGLNEGNALPAMILSAFGDYGLIGLKVVGVACIIGLALALEKRYPRLWHGVAAAIVLTTVVVTLNTVSIAMAAS